MPVMTLGKAEDNDDAKDESGRETPIGITQNLISVI